MTDVALYYAENVMITCHSNHALTLSCAGFTAGCFYLRRPDSRCQSCCVSTLGAWNYLLGYAEQTPMSAKCVQTSKAPAWPWVLSARCGQHIQALHIQALPVVPLSCVWRRAEPGKSGGPGATGGPASPRRGATHNGRRRHPGVGRECLGSQPDMISQPYEWH